MLLSVFWVWGTERERERQTARERERERDAEGTDFSITSQFARREKCRYFF